MTVLAAGATATITVAATDMILIDSPSGGTAKIEAVSGVAGSSFSKILAEHRGGRAQYGPFGAGDIKLGALGADLRYALGSNPQIADPGLVYTAIDSNGNVSGLVGPDNALLALSEVSAYVNLTATGTAHTGVGEFAGYICTVAAGNITIYDNTSAAGTVIVPTTALAVGAFPIFGAGTNGKMALTTGCHVVLSGAATVNVLVG